VNLSWWRALELAVDIRKAMPWHAVRWKSTSHVSLESPLGARREAAHAGGGSQPEGRYGLAAEVRTDRPPPEKSGA
jgi:hypothetical protein